MAWINSLFSLCVTPSQQQKKNQLEAGFNFSLCGDVCTLNQHKEKWQETNLSDQLFSLRQLSIQLTK